MPNGRHFLIVVHADKRGRDVFTPCNSTDVKKTQEDAEARLGLTSAN